MKNISCLIPTWCTATHALNAYRSFHKFYPEIPVYFVSDKIDQQGENDWRRLHPNGWDSLDTDYSKVIGLENSCYIEKDHFGWETEGHGNAVTHAMKFIHTKWVIHLSDDVRILKAGIVEWMISATDDMTVAVGEDFSRDWGPNVGKWLCAYRGDIYHEFNMDFRGDYKNCKDAGSLYFQAMIEKGYNIRYIGMNEFYQHLGSIRAKENQWDKYYIFNE